MSRPIATTMRLVITVIMAAGVCAGSTAPASANWLVGKSQLEGTAALATTASVDQRFELKGGGVTIECKGTALNAASPQIVASSRITAASLTFGECKTTAEPCSLGSTTILTVPLVGEVTGLTSPEDEAVFSPQTKSTFATIKFNGETCALLGTQPITGTLGTVLPKGQEERTQQEVKASTTKGELKLGSNEAELKGSALLKLTTGAVFADLVPRITVNPLESTHKVEVGQTTEQTFVFTNHGPGNWISRGKEFHEAENPLGGAEFAVNDECFPKITEVNKTCNVTIKIKVNVAGKYTQFWNLEGAPGIAFTAET